MSKQENTGALPPEMLDQLDKLLCTTYSRQDAAEQLRAIIEYLLFSTTEPLPLDIMEAMAVPWDLMYILQGREPRSAGH